MATIAQIRGMLLEEVVLYLLRASGYETIDQQGNDPTLRDGRSGLEVRGRGEHHQIDSVADFLIPQPFGYPNRLLVEAKFKEKPIGIDVVRNAVGVVKDVSEFFTPPTRTRDIPVKRYHYQMAIVSASRFTEGAQRYAFAQDIDLIPLQSSTFFDPIREAIAALTNEDVPEETQQRGYQAIKMLRQRFRWALRDHGDFQETAVQTVVNATKRVNAAFLAVAGRRQRLFLVPESRDRIDNLADETYIRITFDDSGWYIYDQNNRRLFSFDMPSELFELYAEQGMLQPNRALQLKGDVLNEIHVYVTHENRFRFIRLVLDQGWINEVRTRL